MKTILMLAERIRNEVNERQLERTRFLNRLDDWFALCVAMDYLEDSGLALLNYQEKGLGSKGGEKYLRLMASSKRLSSSRTQFGICTRSLLGVNSNILGRQAG